MKYSISEAARIVGITRKTFYKHIDKKGISMEKDDNRNPLVDASELIRIYGDRCHFETEERQPRPHKELGAAENASDNTPNKDTVELAVLKERLSNVEEQRNHLEKLYQQEREERQAGMRLLADQRGKQDNWERTFTEIQSQITKQESERKKELESFKEETERKLRIYRRALQAERNKSFWERLFPAKRKTGQGA